MVTKYLEEQNNSQSYKEVDDEIIASRQMFLFKKGIIIPIMAQQTNRHCLKLLMQRN